jgi:hypothetical protein
MQRSVSTTSACNPQRFEANRGITIQRAFFGPMITSKKRCLKGQTPGPLP